MKCQFPTEMLSFGTEAQLGKESACPGSLGHSSVGGKPARIPRLWDMESGGAERCTTGLLEAIRCSLLGWDLKWD